jgi:hypothetical protein
MIALDGLIAQVQRNCDISDAHHSGIFSICGLALRLRDLFKWEHGLAPWEEGDPAAVLDWIGAREAHWETLAEAELEALAVSGRPVDPFDSEAVNSLLAPQRLYYGAGYARGLKPTFFIAEIDSEEVIEDCRVYRLGREVARDLSPLPAASQNGTIVLRRQSASSLLWDQIVYVTPSGQKALDAALAACGVADRRPSEVRRRWDELLRVQEAIHLRHELGEIRESGFPRDRWQEMIAAFPLSRIELLARHVKDLLADTHPLGPLCHFERRREAAGLGLYSAFTDRLTRNLHPELLPAAEEILAAGNWIVLASAVAAGRATARRCAEILVNVFEDASSRQDLDGLPAAIDRLLGRYLDGGPSDPH